MLTFSRPRVRVKQSSIYSSQILFRSAFLEIRINVLLSQDGKNKEHRSQSDRSRSHQDNFFIQSSIYNFFFLLTRRVWKLIFSSLCPWSVSWNLYDSRDYNRIFFWWTIIFYGNHIHMSMIFFNELIHIGVFTEDEDFLLLSVSLI